ncbi:competence protein CoiA [Lysinibacillus sphaericus]|uniref:competence protein CoiA n=1 Tax=Lysinibacillus sphaericus TaxID=1421 RepID=UPI001C5FEBC9
MLIAHTEHGKPFISYQHTRDALRLFRKNSNFFCPQCQQPVQLKIGTVNIPHFAHIANQVCERLFAEGESMLHLQGKVQLFEWLKKLGHTVELEPFIKRLSQRPDILVTKEHHQIAIEFQCSALSFEKWQLRTAGYESIHIKALWLFQTPKKNLTSQDTLKITIPPIIQQAITYPYKGLPYLMTYDAHAARFNYWTNLLYVQGYTFIAKLQYVPIEKQQFPFYVPKPVTKEAFDSYWQLYKKICAQYGYQRLLRSKKGVQDTFLRSCYELRYSLEAMPVYVGIPVKNAEAIPMFSLEWQTILHHFCRQYQLHPPALCHADIQLFLLQLDLEVTSNAVRAVKNYCKVFEKWMQNKDNFPNIAEQVYVHFFNINGE